ncbi:hypothetical protein [Pseudomonas sp. F1002]|uniref:hypothetical protein n=1 Tax=Pseudomonas sp. F1002 TaxID=2738821 RepID=UPI0015A1C751|nr:hypothetical protein [Pseudomonas sp. F1002]NWB63671.1 hypothetical protein [Pseudomonas sp. F1002]
MSWEVVSCWIEAHPGLAAWLQAVFSVLAICAAGYFPIAHEERRARRERCDVLRGLGYFSSTLHGYFIQLSRATLEPDQHRRWLFSDNSRRLNVLGQALNEIPASMVVGFELALLTDLKHACLHAIDIDSFLKSRTPGNIRDLVDDFRYSDICRACLVDIQLVQETVDGLMAANH